MKSLLLAYEAIPYLLPEGPLSEHLRVVSAQLEIQDGDQSLSGTTMALVDVTMYDFAPCREHDYDVMQGKPTLQNFWDIQVCFCFARM